MTLQHIVPALGDGMKCPLFPTAIVTILSINSHLPVTLFFFQPVGVTTMIEKSQNMTQFDKMCGERQIPVFIPILFLKKVFPDRDRDPE